MKLLMDIIKVVIAAPLAFLTYYVVTWLFN